MAFSDEVHDFSNKLPELTDAVYHGVCDEIFRSIRFGSELTGAPGQPVQSSNLLNSWFEKPESEESTLIGTNVVYAPGIEDGISMQTGKPMQVRSPVGGFNSVKLTQAGLQNIVDKVLEDVAK